MKNLLRAEYGLPDAELHPIAMGAVNENLRVEAADATYVLKRVDPKLYTAEHLERTCDIQVRLGALGLPVPAILPNLRGEALTRTPDAFYSLYRFVPGRHYRRGEIPAPAAYAMGRALGDLLVALASLLPSEPFRAPDPGEGANLLRHILSLAERGTEPLDAVAGQVLRHKLEALERLAHLAPRFAGLASQWVHGDYQETNVLFDQEDQVAAVVDWDNFRCRPRAWEFMRAFAYCFPEGAPEGEPFFRGYAEVAGPDPTEVALYAPLWCYVSATRIWPMEDRYLRPETYQSRWDRFIVPPSGWWEHAMDRVTERFLRWLGR